jgi:hypothetical protein
MRYSQIWCIAGLLHDASGGEFLLNRQIVLHQLTDLEGNPLQQQFGFVRTTYFAPTLFGFLDKFECQSKERLA